MLRIDHNGIRFTARGGFSRSQCKSAVIGGDVPRGLRERAGGHRVATESFKRGATKTLVPLSRYLRRAKIETRSASGSLDVASVSVH